MGISTSSTLSRERAADVEASTAAVEAVAETDEQPKVTVASRTVDQSLAHHCVNSVSATVQFSPSLEATSSADEMSDDDNRSGRQDQRTQGQQRESASVDTTDDDASGGASASASEVTDPHHPTSDQSLAEFREELRIKREQRRTAIADLKNEVVQLRADLAAERRANEQLRQGGGSGGDALEAAVAEGEEPLPGDADETASPRSSVERVLRMQLANVNHQLQLANGDVLSMGAELAITQKQVGTLKEVIAVSKEMVKIREDQLEQMRSKLKEIEDSLAEREVTLMSDTLRKEYDRQLANIRSLRTLYEERARVSAAEKENLMRQLETKRAELETEMKKSQDLEARVATLETDLQEAIDNLANVKDDLIDSNAEKKGLEEQTAVINQLFSQLLSGFNGGNDLNIDRLAVMLEDNRDLLNDITTNETCKTRAAAMPKLLLDLVSQIDEQRPAEEQVINEETSTDTTDSIQVCELPAQPQTPAATDRKQEILNNLPKVWKVLIELLNHQQADTVPISDKGDTDDCYKQIATPTGTQNVLSVSKTYIRLKDLILEKKSLQKETHKLKNLNTHLETQLDQKERRLATVTVELNKTWTLVGRMQRQHRQLHTNEQVLRYQLSQKRRMLNELKEELEYCRRKWTLAREKNDESQEQWTALRSEFTARKLQDAGSQLSAESGYSDGPDEDEEPLLMTTAEQMIDDVDESELIEDTSCSAGVEELNDCQSIPAAVIIGMPVIVQNDGGQSTSSGSQNGNGAGPGKSTLKLSRELRKKKPKTHKAPKTASSGAESLEQMFYRISGLEQPEPSSESEASDSEESEYDDEDIDEAIDAEAEPSISDTTETTDLNIVADDEDDDDDDANTEHDSTTTATSDRILSDFVDPEDEERQQRRAQRFERLEEQCQQLISQVRRTSSRGEELNRQLDVVHNRYRTPTRENSTTADVAGPSTAPDGLVSASTAEEDASLTVREQEYTSRRAARLQRLEEECKAFLDRMNVSNSKATELSEKATTLHEHHSARRARMEGTSEAVAGEASTSEIEQTPDQNPDSASESAAPIDGTLTERPADASDSNTCNDQVNQVPSHVEPSRTPTHTTVDILASVTEQSEPNIKPPSETTVESAAAITSTEPTDIEPQPAPEESPVNSSSTSAEPSASNDTPSTE